MLRSSTDMLNLLVNPFAWDKEFYKFDRWNMDMRPYYIKYDDKEKKAIISHNILGIEKKDLKVSVDKEDGVTYLVIAGHTVDEISKKQFSVNSRFALDENSYDTDKIEATAKNGLVYITIPYKEQVKENQTKTVKIR